MDNSRRTTSSEMRQAIMRRAYERQRASVRADQVKNSPMNSKGSLLPNSKLAPSISPPKLDSSQDLKISGPNAIVDSSLQLSTPQFIHGDEELRIFPAYLLEDMKTGLLEDDLAEDSFTAAIADKRDELSDPRIEFYTIATGETLLFAEYAYSSTRKVTVVKQREGGDFMDGNAVIIVYVKHGWAIWWSSREKNSDFPRMFATVNHHCRVSKRQIKVDNSNEGEQSNDREKRPCLGGWGTTEPEDTATDGKPVMSNQPRTRVPQIVESINVLFVFKNNPSGAEQRVRSFKECDTVQKLFSQALCARIITTHDLVLSVLLPNDKSLFLMKTDLADFEALTVELEALCEGAGDEQYRVLVTGINE